jgi:hypothetical protein
MKEFPQRREKGKSTTVETTRQLSTDYGPVIRDKKYSQNSRFGRSRSNFDHFWQIITKVVADLS